MKELFKSPANESGAASHAVHREEREGLFETLPKEVTRYLFKFMDIPSLSVLSQTSMHKEPTVSCLADDDVTWLHIVQRRFNIILSTHKRVNPIAPKLYGGSSWKAAYRSMAACNRIPRTRFTTKNKICFAKGPDSRKSLDLSDAEQHLGNFVSLWVFLGHTEDCNTRRSDESINQGSIMTIGNEPREDTNSGQVRRFVELRLCLQNTKSGFGTIGVDVSNTSVHFLGIGGRGGVCVRGPRVLFHRRHDNSGKHECSSSRRGSFSDPNDLFLSEKNQTVFDLELRPFEFAIVSVQVPCSPDMTYETDFLSRASSVRVPFHWKGRAGNSGKAPIQLEAVSFSASAKAAFLPEKDMWKHYTQLPGGCLTLVDRSRLVAL